MSTVLILIICVIFEIFDLLILRHYKKAPIAILCALMGCAIIFNAVMLILKLQLEPFVLGLEVAVILASEFIIIVAYAPEIRIAAAAVLIFIALALLVVHNTSIVKDFNQKEYIGLYSKNTGFGETKITYYERKAYPFISSEAYCTENYGIIMGEPDFDKIAPYSIDFYQ